MKRSYESHVSEFPEYKLVSYLILDWPFHIASRPSVVDQKVTST